MKLSIITINYNNASGLRKTMESVFAQTYRDFEYIVVDGASTDESVDVIKEIAARPITHNLSPITFTWLSEPDTGIYNAMNKGTEIAEGRRVVNSFNRSEFVEDKHGEADRPNGTEVENKGKNYGYVLMLNSGDFLVDEHVIERVMPTLDGTDIIQGNLVVERKGKQYRNRGYGRSSIDMVDVMNGDFLHQASFCRRDLFERFGYFDESYRMIADTKFFMLCLGKHDATFRYIDVDVTNYDTTGISAEKTGKWAQCRKEETVRLRKDMFSDRLYTFLQDSEKKIKLYDNLHTRPWIWNLTKALAYINNWLNKK